MSNKGSPFCFHITGIVCNLHVLYGAEELPPKAIEGVVIQAWSTTMLRFVRIILRNFLCRAHSCLVGSEGGYEKVIGYGVLNKTRILVFGPRVSLDVWLSQRAGITKLSTCSVTPS
jgi:hypothetical protein